MNIAFVITESVELPSRESFIRRMNGNGIFTFINFIYLIYPSTGGFFFLIYKRTHVSNAALIASVTIQFFVRPAIM